MCWQQQPSLLFNVFVVCLAWLGLQYSPKLVLYRGNIQRDERSVAVDHVRALIRVDSWILDTKSLLFRLHQLNLCHTLVPNASLLWNQFEAGPQRSNLE